MSRSLLLAPVLAVLTLFSFVSNSFALSETEPNDAFSSATPLNLSAGQVVTGYIQVNGDVDFYSFQANAGERIYSAVMTSGSASFSTDSVLDLIASDGVTVLESDDNDGTFATTASTIAGRLIPTNGTYYVKVRHFSPSSQIRPYKLYLSKQASVDLATESEPNSSLGSANSIDSTGYIQGAVSAVSDMDYYAITLNAGDTIFASLDLDPERDGTTFNGRLSFYPGSLALITNDTNTTSPNSEAFFYTVATAGIYQISVDEAASGGDPNFTYQLSVTVIPGRDLSNCQTYSNAVGLPLAIGPDPSAGEHTITVSDAPRIGSMRVNLDITHWFFNDIDLTLRGPDGAEIQLFTDVGPTSMGNVNANFVLSDDGALPINSFVTFTNAIVQPESASTLSLFNGSSPNGDWKLTVRDDASADGGSLNSWSLTICPQDPICPTGSIPSTVYSADFESGDAGYSHSGTADEWELGTPTVAPIQSCNSGTSCWKTDLDGTYNASSIQTLLSPSIDLSGVTGPMMLSWAQKYQLESANFDRYSVTASEVGNPSSAVTAFDWMGASMSTTVGNPSVTIQNSSAWGIFVKDISSLAGKQVELAFKLSSDTTVQFSGAAIDDISIVACLADTDGDGIADGGDGCPLDSSKLFPGTCGCGVSDVDSDTDGVSDCNDQCPANSAKTLVGICGCNVADSDTDNDGTPDCVDLCAQDNLKSAPGVCGCGVIDQDLNSNSVLDCNVSGEFRTRYVELLSLIGKVKAPKNKKQAAALKTTKTRILTLLGETAGILGSSSTQIKLLQAIDLASTASKVAKSVKKALKTSSKNFAKNKKAAKKAVGGLLAIVQG